MSSGRTRYHAAVLVRYDGPPDQVSHDVARALAAQREPATVELENQLEALPQKTVLGTDTGGEASAILEPGRAYNLPHELAEKLIESSMWWSRVTDYDKLSKDALQELAGEREIEGRSSMTKAELVKALRDTPAPTPPEPVAGDTAGSTPTSDIGSADAATTAPAAAPAGGA